MPCCHLDLTPRLWAWQWCPRASPCGDWAEAILSKFLWSTSVFPPGLQGELASLLCLYARQAMPIPGFPCTPSRELREAGSRVQSKTCPPAACRAMFCDKRLCAKGHFAHTSGAAFSVLLIKNKFLKICDVSTDFLFLIIFTGKTGKWEQELPSQCYKSEAMDIPVQLTHLGFLLLVSECGSPVVCQFWHP